MGPGADGKAAAGHGHFAQVGSGIVLGSDIPAGEGQALLHGGNGQAAAGKSHILRHSAAAGGEDGNISGGKGELLGGDGGIAAGNGDTAAGQLGASHRIEGGIAAIQRKGTAGKRQGFAGGKAPRAIAHDLLPVDDGLFFGGLLLGQTAPQAPFFGGLAITGVAAAAAGGDVVLPCRGRKAPGRRDAVPAADEGHCAPCQRHAALPGFGGTGRKAGAAAGDGKLSAADLQLLPGNQSVPPGGDLQGAFRHGQGALAAQGVIVDGLHRKAAPAGDEQVALHADGGFPHLAAGIEIAFAIGDGILGAILQQQHHGAAAIGVDDRAPFTVHIHPAQHQPGRFPRRDLHGELGILQSTAEQVGAPLGDGDPGSGGGDIGGIADDGIDIELQDVVGLLLPLGMIRRHGCGHGFQRFVFLRGMAATRQQQNYRQQKH